MQISNANMSTQSYENAKNSVKAQLKDIGIDTDKVDLKNIKGKDIMNALIKESMSFSSDAFSMQAGISNFAKNAGLDDEFLENLTPEKAKELISEDGYWGANKTGERIANFVLAGAGDDVEKLKAGREGILRGFNQASKILGGLDPKNGYGKLAHDTMDKALSTIDEKIASLGEKIIDIKA